MILRSASHEPPPLSWVHNAPRPYSRRRRPCRRRSQSRDRRTRVVRHRHPAAAATILRSYFGKGNSTISNAQEEPHHRRSSCGVRHSVRKGHRSRFVLLTHDRSRPVCNIYQKKMSCFAENVSGHPEGTPKYPEALKLSTDTPETHSEHPKVLRDSFQTQSRHIQGADVARTKFTASVTSSAPNSGFWSFSSSCTKRRRTDGQSTPIQCRRDLPALTGA